MSHAVGLLDPWEFRGNHRDVRIPSGRLRVLLISLLLSANETVPVDVLAEQLWPELSLLREALALWRGTPFVGINSD